MSELVACIEGLGVLGPGLPDWSTTAAVLSGQQPYAAARTVLPDPAALPATERRRAGRLIRLALAVGAEAVGHSGREARTLPSVFSSSSGDGETLHAICEALATPERLISPTRFHNSVHNAASGYWSIAQGCTLPSTALCAFDASFGAGLLEAMAQVGESGEAVLLIAYDADYPPPLYAKRAIPDAFGVALILGPAGSPGARAALHVALAADAADTIADPVLEAMRTAIPAARVLPLLERLARRTGSAPATVVLDYLDTARLRVRIDA
ncbi:MAG TPA: beta-ketoacyl synthase chain length factor [Steroidobacteraceae bacterium]|nr:beta-ketoacyl synthase chain length factor [Steroidobacteraceae bacterium]